MSSSSLFWLWIHFGLQLLEFYFHYILFSESRIVLLWCWRTSIPITSSFFDWIFLFIHFLCFFRFCYVVFLVVIVVFVVVILFASTLPYYLFSLLLLLIVRCITINGYMHSAVESLCVCSTCNNNMLSPKTVNRTCSHLLITCCWCVFSTSEHSFGVLCVCAFVSGYFGFLVYKWLFLFVLLCLIQFPICHTLSCLVLVLYSCHSFLFFFYFVNFRKSHGTFSFRFFYKTNVLLDLSACLCMFHSISFSLVMLKYRQPVSLLNVSAYLKYRKTYTVCDEQSLKSVVKIFGLEFT